MGRLDRVRRPLPRGRRPGFRLGAPVAAVLAAVGLAAWLSGDHVAWAAAGVTRDTAAGGGYAGFERFWGPLYRVGRLGDLEDGLLDSRRRPRPMTLRDRLERWNQVAIDAAGLDHTPVPPGSDRVFGEQYGPGRSSRAMAIVHVAVFDAMNAILGGYQSYTGIASGPPGASVEAAIAQAAHDTLAALYPSQAAAHGEALATDLESISPRRARNQGIEVGRRAAAATLALRSHDGSQHPEPEMGSEYVPSEAAGKWRQDPVSQMPIALGAHWGSVEMFAPLRVASRFRAAPPPSLASAEYTAAYLETKRLGGDGVITPTERTPEQTFIGIFWAYDGTPSLCAPPRLYNQLVRVVAADRGTGAYDLARLLALANTAMADAATAIWESKYHYELWRPVTAIREADPGTGPTGEGDGNPLTLGDPDFTPMGSPASNLGGPDFTPPFPTYPSGHAGFGGAVFQTLRLFYGTDHIPFTFVSDEWDGTTEDSSGNVRPRIPRSFDRLSQAELENGRSRIYLGIHWAFDAEDGITLGRAVGEHVFRHLFRPVAPAP